MSMDSIEPRKLSASLQFKLLSMVKMHRHNPGKMVKTWTENEFINPTRKFKLLKRQRRATMSRGTSRSAKRDVFLIYTLKNYNIKLMNLKKGFELARTHKL